MVCDVSDRSADYKRYRRLGVRLDDWALASEATVAKHIYAAIASAGTRTFDELVASVSEGTLEGWEPRWVGRLARILVLQPHEEKLHSFAQRALFLAVAELPKVPATLTLRKLNIELLFKREQYERVEEILDADPALDSLYHGYLRTDMLNPFTSGKDAYFDEWLRGFNAPFTARQISPVFVDRRAVTPFDGLTATVPPASVDGPLVSVIVTTFNPDPIEIRTAVNSILKQTWRNLEVLLVDDHSSEEATGTLEVLAATDSRIRLIRLPTNGGTYRARNAGIHAAKGKYLTGQDTDDWSHPERIETQVMQMEENPKLIGVTTAANRTNDLLVKMAPGHNPHRKCEVSLMLRVEDARAIGGYLPVRKAADSEFRERLEAWSGTTTQLIDVPLYIIRMSIGSLSRTDFRPGWSHPARRAFWSSYKYWHRGSPGEALAIDATTDVAGIPSSTPSKIAGREWMKEEEEEVDVCLVADWRGDTPQQRAARDELNALAKTDLRVAILHLDTPLGATREPRALHPAVQKIISSGKVSRIFLDQAIDVNLMLIRAPETMDFALRAPSEVRCSHVVLVGHGAIANRCDAVRDYDPRNANSMAATIFGVGPRWSLPEGDSSDDVAERYGITLNNRPYPHYIDRERYAGPRWRRPAGSPMVLGLAASNDELAWPEVGELKQAFPLSGIEQVRVLGDARGALRTLGRNHLPSNWVQFRDGEISDSVFWKTVDVAVVADRGASGIGLDRTALEAICSGTVVVTDPARARSYEGAAVSCKAHEQLPVIRTLLKNQNAMQKLRSRGQAFISARSDAAPLERFIRENILESQPGADNHD